MREITPKREGHSGHLGNSWAEGEQAAYLEKMVFLLDMGGI